MKIIEVVPYNPDWPLAFETEAARIKQALGDNYIEIHHIGSTSVPGLAAKPIIDMIPVVCDLGAVNNLAMEALGYETKGEFGIPFRSYFTKGFRLRTHNIHIFEQGNLEIERHLNFRDWMRNNPADRNAYAELKNGLAEKFPNDIESYCIGKDEFVANIDAKAGWNGFRFVMAATPREWEAAKNFRQKYIFDLAKINDPYIWTFDNEDHIHFVLYKGANIVGYAHIQLWPENRAAFRIITIGEDARNKGFGGKFLKLCEKWLKSQGYISLHVESCPKAYQFYKKYGYAEMPFNDPDNYEGDERDIPMGKKL